MQVSCISFEFWASQLAQRGDMQGAGAFKRAAGLSLLSLQRWIRPTGDLWILKNRFDPSLRFGYEHYSFATNYNLLPASMLATALLFANESIPEGASFAEVGGFAVVPDQFHKVVANAGGMYVEVELFPDAPTHDALGLARIHHKVADPLVTVTASAPLQPASNPPNSASIAVGPQWGIGRVNQRMSDLSYTDVRTTKTVRGMRNPELVEFQVTYTLTSASIVPNVTEAYS